MSLMRYLCLTISKIRKLTLWPKGCNVATLWPSPYFHSDVEYKEDLSSPEVAFKNTSIRNCIVGTSLTT